MRYRPRRFDQIVGQRHATVVLSRAVALERVPAQLLFSGGSGLGKTTLARVLAAALLCESDVRDARDPFATDACGHCRSCRDLFDPGRHHPDVVELDAASHGGKDEIHRIAERAQLVPMRGRHRIYIVDEAHGLSHAGGQAFLKLLEEPPPHVVFVLATTDPDKMLPTNRGRCTEFELLAPTEDDLVANLLRVAAGENWVLDPELARDVVRASDPRLGVRGTLTNLSKLAPLLEWGTPPDDDELIELLGVLPRRRAVPALAAATAGRRAEALAHVDALRARLPDAVVRRALVDAAHAEFRRDPSDLRALARLERLAAAPPGAVWTDLVVATLADESGERRSDPGPDRPGPRPARRRPAEGPAPAPAAGVPTPPAAAALATALATALAARGERARAALVRSVDSWSIRADALVAHVPPGLAERLQTVASELATALPPGPVIRVTVDVGPTPAPGHDTDG